MSDLIRREDVIKCLQENGWLDDTNIDELIETIPIAYDIDKVVNELEEVKMRYFLTIANTGDEKSDFAYENVGNALDKAIEIVKQGVVSDDVCECRLLKGYKVLYKTSCCNVFEMENGFKFCPYCGKKIKVVE